MYIKLAAGLLVVASLTACGGGRSDYDSRQKNYYQRSIGPIGNACMSSDRKARSPQLCNCIQKAANDRLSRSEQRRVVAFFRDPHQAQVTRQSDKSNDEVFWRTYKSYVSYAEAVCG